MPLQIEARQERTITMIQPFWTEQPEVRAEMLDRNPPLALHA